MCFACYAVCYVLSSELALPLFTFCFFGVVVVVVVVAHVFFTTDSLISDNPSNVAVSNQSTPFCPPDETAARNSSSIASVIPTVKTVDSLWTFLAASSASCLDWNQHTSLIYYVFMLPCNYVWRWFRWDPIWYHYHYISGFRSIIIGVEVVL